MKDAINRFKQYVEQRYPDRSTSKHYMSDLAIFHQNVGNVHPKTITAGMISDFVEAQSNQGLKGSTINRRLSALSSFFEFLIFESEDDDWSNGMCQEIETQFANNYAPIATCGERVTTPCTRLARCSPGSRARSAGPAAPLDPVCAPVAAATGVVTSARLGCLAD